MKSNEERHYIYKMQEEPEFNVILGYMVKLRSSLASQTLSWIKQDTRGRYDAIYSLKFL